MTEVVLFHHAQGLTPGVRAFAETQSGNAATLAAIQSELTELRTRLAAVENILKTVE